MNELLLGELRTNHERVILPSSRSKIKKKLSSLTNQHSVILPAMLLWSEIMLVISNRTHAARSFNFEITRMISDQIALHSVQLPLLIFKICSLHRVCLSTVKYRADGIDSLQLSSTDELRKYCIESGEFVTTNYDRL